MVPIGGTITIAAPVNGTLLRVRVSEGQQIKQGDILFELSTEQHGSSGNLSALIAQQLSVRHQALEAERRAALEQNSDKRRALESSLHNVSAQIGQLNDEIDMVGRRESYAQNSVDDYQALRRDGFVSSAQLRQQQEMLLEMAVRRRSMERRRTELDANRLNLLAEQAALKTRLATDLARVDQSIASLASESLENERRGTLLIRAPQAGVVGSLAYEAGQALIANQPLGTIRPAEPGAELPLEVQLYAPSRTAGFIKIGQPVYIRYHAFPYQKYGLQKGVVSNVGLTPFTPAELPSQLASMILSNTQQAISGVSNGEGLYRIKVRLSNQSIAIDGGQQLIKPGMTLDADVEQDRRRIWEWIAAPMFAVTRH
ncbi:HlyD family secretion protein [Massilia sp. MB5]|uniref:HlyD family secretion protein n=1 Tax=Massilia sp. MB5 TaxID=2919578 RepID=UPI001F0F4759|nr:HlyD family efflux transporter periplasmic adaptor subunit [Massilia sp. MB5]UMR29229.1 HlyD family secretion protein [Massilia sp. MB5]